MCGQATASPSGSKELIVTRIARLSVFTASAVAVGLLVFSPAGAQTGKTKAKTKPIKQAVAIAYSVQRKAASKTAAKGKK